MQQKLILVIMPPFQNNLSKIFLIFFLLISVSASTQKTNKNNSLSEQAQMEFYRNFYEGNKQKMLGNFSEAALFFTRCTQINPKSSTAYYELARAFNNQGNYMGALVHARHAADIDNSNKWYLLLLASLYEQNNLPNAALKTYEELIKLLPEEPNYYLQLGMMLTKQGKTKAAIKAYNKAEAIIGINEQISLEKERVYLLSDNKEKAIEEIIKLKNAFPSETRYYGILAESYLDNKQPEKALQIYEDIIKQDPGNGLAHLSLAEFYYNGGNTELSFNHLKKAFASLDVDADLKIKMLARFVPYAAKSELVKTQATDLLQILLITHPNDVKVHTLNADFLSINGEYEAAREKYRLVLKTEKDKYIIWEQLLLIENELKEYQGMFLEATEAIECFPNLPQFYLFYGLAAVKIGKDKDAIEKLLLGMDLLVENQILKIQFLSFLAEAYGNSANLEKAVKTYEEALVLAPEDEILLFDFSKFLSKNNLQLEKASEIIQKAIKFADEDKPDFYEIYGDILFKLGNIALAEEQWRKSQSLGNDSETLKNKIEQGLKQE